MVRHWQLGGLGVVAVREQVGKPAFAVVRVVISYVEFAFFLTYLVDDEVEATAYLL